MTTGRIDPGAPAQALERHAHALDTRARALNIAPACLLPGAPASARAAVPPRAVPVSAVPVSALPVSALALGQIEVRCFDSLDAVGHLGAAIDALNRASAHPDPFSTWAFYRAYVSDEEIAPGGADTQIWFLTAWRDGELVGYLALRHRVKRWLGLRIATLGFLVTHDTDRPHLVARAADQRAVSAACWAHLIGRQREWSYLEFQQQDARSALFPPPAEVNLSTCRVCDWPSLENGTIPIFWDTLGDYLQALGKRFRSNLGRQFEQLLASGTVQWLSSSDPACTPALFELYLGIEARSWKSLADAHIGRHPRRIAYFERLFDPQQPMQLSVQLLLLDGVPIAGLINGAYLDGLYALHIVYDDGLSRLGPGSVMLMMGVRSAIAGRFARFNLLSGFGYYKVRWLAQMTPTRIAQVYRVGSPLDWRRRAGDWRRRLQASPLAERLLGIAAGWGVSRRNGGDPDTASAAADAAPPSSADASATTPAVPAPLHGLARFNPVRRRVMAPTERSAAPLRDHAHPLSSDQQARTATLLAQLDTQVHAGRCERLDALQLTALLARTHLPMQKRPKMSPSKSSLL